MTLEEMVCGLVRAAEFKEQQEGAPLWDTECREALEEARRRGFGNGKPGSLECAPEAPTPKAHRALPRVSVTFACPHCENSSCQPLTVASVPALQRQMERYAVFHCPGVNSHDRGVPTPVSVAQWPVDPIALTKPETE